MPPIVIGLGNSADTSEFKDPLGLYGGGGLKPKVGETASKVEPLPSRVVNKNSSFDQKDWNDLVDTVIAEAAGDGRQGMAAVASVIKNRAAARGISPGDVVRQPSQFEGYENPRESSRKAQQDPAVRTEAEKILQGVFDGTLQDPTGGADHFHADYVSPDWAKTMPPTTKIGGHTFYSSKGKPKAAETASGIAIGENFEVKDGLGLYGGNDPFAAVDKETAARAAAEQSGNHVPNPSAKGLARLVRPEAEAPAGTGGQLFFSHPEQDKLAPAFESILVGTSKAIGRDLTVLSGYRSPQHRVEAAKAGGPGEHSRGDASDISMKGMSDDERSALVQDLVARGAKRFITYTDSPDMLHVDLKDQRGDGSPWFMHDKTNAKLKNAPRWFQDIAYGKAQRPAPQSGEAGGAPAGIVVSGDFQPKNDMQLYGDANPLKAASEAQTAQVEQTAAQVQQEQAESAVAAENQRIEQARQTLDTEKPGRYTTIDETELGAWQQQWEAENRSTGMGGDTARIAKIGLGNTSLALREAVGQIPGVGSTIVAGLDGIYEWAKGEGPEARIGRETAKAEASLSPAMAESRKKEWITEQKVPGTENTWKFSLGPAWSDPRSYISGLVESAPGTAATMAPSALAARGAFKRAVAAGLAEKEASAAAATTALLSGAIGEGILGGGQSAMAVRERINALPRETVLTSEAVQSMIAEGMSEDAAINAVTEDAATQAFIISGAATGLFGGFGDRTLAKILAEGVGGTVAKRILAGAGRGFVGEGLLEEAPQSAAAQAAENLSVQEADPNQRIGEGVADAAAGGFAVGGVMGGALGGAGGAARPAQEQEKVAAPVETPPGTGATEQAPPAGARRAGPLTSAVQHGERQAAQQQEQSVGAKVAAAAAASSGIRPEPGSTVRVEGEGIEPFMARVESYDGDEAVVIDGSSGEVYQIPIGSMTEIAKPPSGLLLPTRDALPESSSDEALRPQDPIAGETTSELPPRSEQMPALEKLPSAPQPGQRVIVDTPELGRFAARVGSYEEGATEVLVTNDAGQSYQVPADKLFVSKLSEKQVEEQELKRNPPVERDTPELTGTDRRLGDKTISMANALHARLYDLGKERLTSKRLMGTSQLGMDEALPAEQRALAKEFGIDPQALGQMADDFRYRVERAAKEAKSKLPVKMPPVNEKRLKDWQAEHRRAGALDEPVVPVDEAKAWWDAMPPAERRVVLDTAGIKRSEKLDWAAHSGGVRTKLNAIRSAGQSAAPAIDESAHIAATSPTNDLPEPTQAQKEAGNYKVGRLKLGGLDISVENPAGSERSGVDRGGKAWSIKMKSHYGYIRGTVGKDKDHIDVFVRPGTTELAADAPVFVIDQHTRDRKFDEHKVMFGYRSQDEAEKAYLENYTDDWELGPVGATTIAGFKQWLKTGDTTAPTSALGNEHLFDHTGQVGRRRKSGQSAPDVAEGDTVAHIHRTMADRVSPTEFARRVAQSRHSQESAVIEPNGKLLVLKATSNPFGDHAEFFGRLYDIGVVPSESGYVRITSSGNQIGASADGKLPEAAAATLKAVQTAAAREGLTFTGEIAATGEAVRVSADARPEVPKTEEVEPATAKPDASYVKELFRSKEFKAAYADIAATQMGTPHPESSVAFELARGWRDQREGRSPEHQPVPSGTSDPIEPYYMGYAAARDGKARVIRASEQERAYAELSGPREVLATPKTPTSKTASKQKLPVTANTVFTDDAAEKARALLRKKLSGSTLNSGIDPEIMQAGITLAGYHIEKGARTFAAFASAMLADLGDVARPYLKSWYMGVKYDPRAAAFDGMSPAADVDAADVSVISSDGNRSDGDGSAELDRPGPGALEGTPAEEVRGAESRRDAGKQPARSSEPDLFGSEPAGRERVSAGRSVADGSRELSPASGRGDGNRAAERQPDAANAASREQRSADDGRELNSAAVPAQQRPVDYTLSDDDKLGEGGAKAKFRGNVAAIKLLRVLEQENRPATRDEQAVLAKWVGWGGLRPAFGRDDATVNKGWEKEAAELKELLTPEEYRAAESSTRNAHYTSPEIVSGVWSAVRRLGFRGGQMLEPSLGAGNFLGLMPGQLAAGTNITGVELDHITGGIAKNLYPSANIQAPVGFQDFTVPDDFFDLAIGNPPFGSERLYDKERRHLNKLSIHNFFFAKAIEALRPGGVLAMVVTNRFLDGSIPAAREMIAKQADLVGAIRLPNNAFLKNAGTEVTTDIVLLRKHVEGDKPGASWTTVKDYRGADGKTVPLNEYFVANPDMMLGDFGAYGTMYGPDDPALVAREGQETSALLKRAIGKLPQDIMAAPGAAVVPESVTVPETVGDALVGSMFLSPDGAVHVRTADVLGKPQSAPAEFRSDTAKERVSGMVRIRDAFAKLRRAQIDEASTDAKLDNLRKRLNDFYDAFTKKHGPINAEANRRLFRDDPTWPQISALEEGFDKGVTANQAKVTGETARLPSARKSPIFTKRTQQPYKRPTSATSAKDALATTLADLGRVDLAAMSRLYGKSEAAIVDELGPLLFKTPAGAYETADHYLSGNVRAKLAQAEDAARDNTEFRRNVAALRDVIPADIEAVDIDVKPGAPWVPAAHIEDFISHIADSRVKPKAYWSGANAKWAIDVPNPSSAADAQWSTERTSVGSVLDAVLNGQTMTIRDRMNDGSSVINQAATDAANEKAERVKAEWRKWLWQDDTRREQLARLYNDTFNTDVIRRFEGSHLSLPGKVSDDIISLRPHQKNFVWRTLQSSTTLADHTVGAGKTFALIAAAMEMRRTGQAKKPMFAVPNHLVGQWAADFVKLYPGAKVLAATKKDFEAENRKRLFARVATGDWDAVIVSHSSFGKIGVDPEFEKAFIEQQIADIEASTIELRRATGEKSRNVAQLTKWRDNLKTKLQRLIDSGAKDVGMTFDEMGVDALFVDEAHEFKNLGFSTSMTRVAGLGNPLGSQKAADLYMKVLSVQKRTGGKNIVFATGTPLSNTMAEMFTVQRYLDGTALKQLGVGHFDAWARVFGEIVTDWELSPSGQYRLNSRFAKFVNMPELMQRYLSFADVITNDDIKAQLAAIGKTLPLPKVKGGKPNNVVVERSADQASYIGEGKTGDDGQLTFPQGSLVWRAENLPKKAEKGSDNMLKVMSDARKAALDMRLIDPSYGDVAGSKVHVAADNMKRIYDAWSQKKGTQLVFIDLSTPKKARAKEEARIRELIAKAEQGDDAAQTALDNMSPDEFEALNGTFSVYDDLKEKLIKRGIPEQEIAFIHDANTDLQKEELFGKVRSGQIRLLFGSTPKMGAGTNVQNRLVALHHLDAPWRPSDLEQRDGRGIRQGNELYSEDPDGFEIEILRYATKNTLDARQWQTIEAKARFIQQMRKGGMKTREIEDIAGEAANAAEMKAAASGNPLILEEMDERRKLRRLEAQSVEHDREQYRIQRRITGMRDDATRITQKMPATEADAATATAAVAQPFAADILGAKIEKPKEMGDAIIKEGIRLIRDGETDADLGSYAGFNLALEHFHTTAFVVSITGADRHEVSIHDIGDADAVGVGMRIINTVKRLADRPAQDREQLADIEKQIPALERQIAPWGDAEELAKTADRHRALLDALRPKQKPAENVAPPADAEFQAAYHGTPHHIGAFSTDKIGTGEGNQSFGWGLYFAEKKEVAAYYRTALSEPTIDGRRPWVNELDALYELEAAGGDIDKALARTEAQIAEVEEEGADGLNRKIATLQAWKKDGVPEIESSGNLYEVDVPEDRELLIYDKPLSEQSPAVKKIIRSLPRAKPGIISRDITKFRATRLNDVIDGKGWDKIDGGSFYSIVGLALQRSESSSERDKAASQFLRNNGIPGHKYLDLHSRGAGTGTYNYVIYDESRVKIIDPNAPKAAAPDGWGFADTGTDTGLGSPEDIQAVNDIIRNVAGLTEVMWMKRIDLPNGAPAWGTTTPTTAGGFYSPGKDIIAIAENTASATNAYHEAFHRLQHLFLSNSEKAVLQAEIGRLRRMVQQRIGREKQAAKMTAHEVEAEAFAAYATGVSTIKPHQALRAAWDRILKAIRQVQNFIQGRGFQTAEDVFDRAKAGDIAKRAPAKAKDGAPQFSIAEDITESRIISEISAKLTDLTPAVLKTIPLNYFTELARSNMTAVGDYLRVKRLLDAYRGKKHAAADSIAQDWLKYVRNGFMGKDKSRAAELSSLMHDATLAGIDPDEPIVGDEVKPGYKDLINRFYKLPDAGIALYRKVRDAYREQAEELDKILLDNVRKAQQIAVDRAEDRHKKEVKRIEASGLDGKAKKQALDDANRAYTTERTKAQWSMKARITKMRMAFEASRVPAPYFPLARFGRYFVSVRDVDGEILHFSKHETASERDRTARAMQKAYPGAKQQTGVMENGNELRAAMDPRVLAEIDEILGGSGIDSTVMDQIWQRYLESMPDLSTRKRFIHRKGTAGFDQDAMRVFASHMFHAAHQMGRLKYGLELQELVNKTKDQANEADDQTRAMTLANELRLRHDWVMNPTGGKVAQIMTSAAFVWYLAASPASAIVNLTQTVMMGVPILGARFGGVGKAGAALLAASKDFVVGKGSAANANLSDDEKRAMAAFYESGLIDRTQSHDIAGVGETGVEYSPMRAKIMGIISWAFHKAEVANREVTALAAYRLARQSGQAEMSAIDTAHDMTWKTHFDYSNSSRPALMQNDLAKVALVFRSYNINMLYRVFRDIHQSVKGESPQARREARHQLAGVVGMMSLMAGVTGTIGFNLAMAVAGMIFGDDDDPMAFEQQFRKSMVDILGPELGGVVLNGVPGHYLGIDLSSRIGMPDLWFRSPTRELQGKDEYQYWVSQIFGATFGLGESLYSGFSIMADEGNVARGLEVMAPKAIRDLMKSYRYVNEGVTSVRGDEILDAGSIDYHDVIAQALGFTPAKVSETWDRNTALKNAETAVNRKRRSLINAWAMAVQMKDKPARDDAIVRIKAFNAVPLNSAVPITGENLKQSLKVRARNASKREDGVLIQNPILGKRLREKLAAKIYD